MSTELIGFAGGLCLTFSFLPQLITTWKTKRAADVSMGMLLITLASAIFYEIYAFRLGLRPVVIMNGIFGIMLMIEIGMKIHFDRINAAIAAVESEAGTQTD